MSEGLGTDVSSKHKDLAVDLASLTAGGIYAPLAPQASFLLEYWTILKKRRWVVIGVVLASVMIAALSAVRQKPMYSAVGRIAINRESAFRLGTKDEPAMDPDTGDYSVDMETQIRVLQSDVICYRVIRALHLDTSPDFGGSSPERLSNSLQVDSARQTSLLGAFRGGLSISSVPATRILEIHYSSHNRQLAAAIVNQLISSYVEENMRARFESTAQTSDWLTKQLADLQMKVEISQEKLVEYQKAHGIVGTGDKENVITSKLDELNNALTQVEGERMEKEAAYHMALSGSPDALTQTKGEQASPLDALRIKQADLSAQMAAASAQFGPKYPKVKELAAQTAELDKQVEAEKNRGVDRAKAEYMKALEHEKVLRAAFEKQKLDASNFNQSEIEYSLLKENAEGYSTLYNGLLQRLKEAEVTAGLKSSNVQIVDQARVPLAPYSPNVPRSLMAGLLIGCFLGMMTVFLFESLDNTVRTPEESEMISGLSTLGIIPTHKASKRGQGAKLLGFADRAKKSHQDHSVREIFSITRPRSEIAEAYRALRTSILLSTGKNSLKVLLVTSAMPKDGKTTTSINIAVALAQSGARVLLIDADMRRPNIHRVLQVSNTSGLSTWLAQTDSDAPHIVPSGVANLDVLPTGPKPPYPAELISGSGFREILDGLRQVYDHIIIDSPPVLSVTDAVLLATSADAVLLVIRSRQTPKGALRRALDVLRHSGTRTLGVVLNAFNVNGEDYAYYRYYYGYGHGSEYYDDKGHEASSQSGEEESSS